jgi:hypothetical protein
MEHIPDIITLLRIQPEIRSIPKNSSQHQSRFSHYGTFAGA